MVGTMDYVAIVAYSKRISMRLWGDYVYIEQPQASLVLKLALLIPGYKTHYNTHFKQILKLSSGHHNAPPTAKTQRAPHTTSAR